jgi:exonuclease SbcC
MIIRSLRLKNIKSYGEGPDGNGVMIRFEPGINRIAGKNGHGKSTLIESLGYALFLTRPVYEEQFDAATYLLRTGKKAGEIEVEFTWEGRSYRLERGLGTQNKRKAKVVLADDGSTEAEGDEPVTEYLCRLFGFRNAERFSELFAKLLGVKQGRLAWPFDSKPAEARGHFEPLLDVEIFRQCFEGLRPVISRFEEIKHGRETELAAAEERIRDRADSPAKLLARRHETEGLTMKVEGAQKEKADAEQEKAVQERSEKTYLETKAAFETVRQKLAVAVQRRESAQQHARESEQAVETVRSAQASYGAYVRAEMELRRLQARQTEKARLEKQQGVARTFRTECAGRAEAARQQADNYSEQAHARSNAADELRNQLAVGRQRLQQDAAEFERLAGSTERAKRSRAALQHELASLSREVQTNAGEMEKILADCRRLAAWDATALTQARVEEEKTDQAAKELARNLAETLRLRETLAQQLTQIRGGLCPFLKEQCRQFDPGKIQADVSAGEKEIERLGREQAESVARHRQAKLSLERLAKQEAGLAQLRKSAEQGIEAMAAKHNRLFPGTLRDHFNGLFSYLMRPADLFEVPSLAPVDAKGILNRLDATDGAARLRDWVAAETAFYEQAAGLFEQISDSLEEKVRAFEARRDDRLRAERDLANHQQNLEKYEHEIKLLNEKSRQAREHAQKSAAESSKAAKLLSELDEKIKPFEGLDSEIGAQQTIKDQSAEGYGKFLGAKSTADRVAERRAALEQASAAQTVAHAELAALQDKVEAARGGFDAGKLEAARKRAVESESRLAAQAVHLENARRDLQREQARFVEWEQARAEREALLAAHGRLEACVELTQMGRRILQRAAPLVAQHVCGRVASRAQQIFNQINDEPVELEWNAERYGLRISPGERRFAMLSGGEQTKLAVAMTLAMLQEFSDLKFCIFDEPTYGVDAESRQKLADAILKVPAAGDKQLEQLLLVSHDDAFEGKIGHVVLIRKTAAEGSVPA